VALRSVVENERRSRIAAGGLAFLVLAAGESEQRVEPLEVVGHGHDVEAAFVAGPGQGLGS